MDSHIVHWGVQPMWPRTVSCDDVMMPNNIPSHSAPRTGGVITGPSFLPKQKVFWSNLSSPLTSCCMGGPAYLCWFAIQNPTSALCDFLMKTKLPALRLSCWKVLTLLTPKVPLKESDNLPQVGRSQTSAAAKLILNSSLTLPSFKIYLARLSFETFPFLVELQPSFVFVIWRVLFLSIRVAGVVNQ